jgi:3-methyladenine DNA glycosylase AlkD
MKALLHSFSHPLKAETSKRFFKTGKGEYSENDVFIGVTIPEIRSIAKKFYKNSSFEEITLFLHSKIHEERMLAIILLTLKFQETQDEIFVNYYINSENIKYINNWDLVDASCYKILGNYLLKEENKVDILYAFAKSKDIWIRRIAIVSTLAFIRNNQFNHTIQIAEILLEDRHNLIHKATGWMLREVGKKNKQLLLEFLAKHHKNMARISLSYAAEKLERNEKAIYY